MQGPAADGDQPGLRVFAAPDHGTRSRFDTRTASGDHAAEFRVRVVDGEGLARGAGIHISGEEQVARGHRSKSGTVAQVDRIGNSPRGDIRGKNSAGNVAVHTIAHLESSAAKRAVVAEGDRTGVVARIAAVGVRAEERDRARAQLGQDARSGNRVRDREGIAAVEKEARVVGHAPRTQGAGRAAVADGQCSGRDQRAAAVSIVGEKIQRAGTDLVDSARS